jgi:O-acetyl-ADP-ribose deacetylase (regulator of RNase III)
MTAKVVLVDINPKMVQAWQTTFEENPEVDILQGSLLDQIVDAWVSPTNSRGSMDGGIDAVIKKHLGEKIEKRVQQAIRQQFGGHMPVGHATCVPTGTDSPRFLISTPTMSASSEDISDSLNVALACAAAFQAVHRQNTLQPGSIASVALPGLGANTGKVPAEICADLMWTAYNLFREHQFADYATMRAALEDQLGDLGTDTSGKASPPKKSTTGKGPVSAPKKSQDIDFDDFE